MNRTPKEEDKQRVLPKSHAPMLVASGVYVTLASLHLVGFHPEVIEALAYLALAECYRRAYR